MFIRLLRVFEQPLAPSRADQSEARQSESSHRHAAIVLTTFSDRFFSHAIPTLQSFKDANLERRVFVVVNGDQDKDFDEAIRNQFLAEALAVYPVSPICFGSARGMAELWNAGARYADQESLIFMNEDLLIDPNGLLEAIELIEAALETRGLVILNESFGHFGLKRKCLLDLGWFDERFLGFGEEDGDFLWRFETNPNYGKSCVLRANHSAIKNIASNIGYLKITGGPTSKYSSFNHEMLRLKYSFKVGPPQGMFQASAEIISAGPNLYPQEAFRRKAQHLLTEESAKAINQELRLLIDGER